MPVITDAPPAAVQADLDSLGAQLDATIPAKAADNLLIATWNIRAFASLTREWTAGSSDNPKRDLRGLRAIIEILSRFDVIAIQEVKGDLRALRDTMRFLGDDWAFLMSDVTAGAAGNDERLAFLFLRQFQARIAAPTVGHHQPEPNSHRRAASRTSAGQHITIQPKRSIARAVTPNVSFGFAGSPETGGDPPVAPSWNSKPCVPGVPDAMRCHLPKKPVR